MDEGLIYVSPLQIYADEAAFQLRSKTCSVQAMRLASDMERRGFQSAHPLLCMRDEHGRLTLIDGFHRRDGAIMAGISEVPVAIFKGTIEDALVAGVAANMGHGRQLEQADFKLAAKKLAAAGLTHNQIAEAFWPMPREAWKVTGGGTLVHPKSYTISKWVRPVQNTRAARAGHAAARLMNPALREAGYPSDEEGVRKVLSSFACAAAVEDHLATIAFDHSREVPSPEWATTGNSGPGTPILFLSDIHAGEVVNKEEMSGHNEFNWGIMEERLSRIFGTAAELLQKHLASPDYDGFVLALGGDMVTGEIHEELKETNDRGILEATFDISAILAGHCKKLADTFGLVHIVGVPGNHGRLDKKPRAKGYTRTNADYHTYRQIQRMLESDDRFTFHFPLSAEARFNVAGRRFKMVHGDQWRGGDGMIGAIGPIMRGVHKQHSAAAAWSSIDPDAPFDTLMCGHFHQTFMSPRVIVNGSVKGYDEYAQRGGFYPERPTQTLVTVHPEHGLTWFVPVYA